MPHDHRTDVVELDARVHRRVLASATDRPMDDPVLADLVRHEAPLLGADQVAGVVSRVRARIGGLGPDPRSLAVWTVPGWDGLEEVVRDLDGVDSPVRLVHGALYRDLGSETL